MKKALAIALLIMFASIASASNYGICDTGIADVQYDNESISRLAQMPGNLPEVDTILIDTWSNRIISD